MATGVGLRIAEDECIAAIVTSGGESGPDSGESPEPCYIVREPVLHMSDDGDTVLGGEPPAGHTHSITGFFAAVGDPKGIPVDAGEAYRAEDLVATALFCLINLAADHLNGPAEFYASHPADWPDQQVRALREALDYLGLRSVVLVNEANLPGSDGGGHGFAHDAARAALAAVLATPAGTTPPDPTHTENSLAVTDVLPALATPEPPAQAYSAALPAADPMLPPAESVLSPAESIPAPAPPGAAPMPPLAQPLPTMIEEAPAAHPPAPGRRGRTPLLIAAAVMFGLVLGGVGVGVIFRDHSTAVPPLPDARSQPATTAPPHPVVPPPTTSAATSAPGQFTTDTPEPTTTSPAPTTTETPPPPATTPGTTSSTRPTRTTSKYPTPYTYPYPYDPVPGLPLPPALQLPQTSTP
jgi:hypothetical protein